MREIKVRAWDTEARCYVEEPVLFDNFGQVYVVCDKTSGRRGTCLIAHKPNAIKEQYTGLKDNNGKEIYEGDILHSKVGTNYVVSYSADRGRYEMWSKDGYGGGIADVQYIKEFDIKVIGSIRDNLQLLGVTNATNKEEE